MGLIRHNGYDPYFRSWNYDEYNKWQDNREEIRKWSEGQWVTEAMIIDNFKKGNEQLKNKIKVLEQDKQELTKCNADFAYTIGDLKHVISTLKQTIRILLNEEK
jgi:hypothetical protein